MKTNQTQTATFADETVTRRLMAAMEAFMAADFVDDIAASAAAEFAHRDTLQQAA